MANVPPDTYWVISAMDVKSFARLLVLGQLFVPRLQDVSYDIFTAFDWEFWSVLVLELIFVSGSKVRVKRLLCCCRQFRSAARDGCSSVYALLRLSRLIIIISQHL